MPYDLMRGLRLKINRANRRTFLDRPKMFCGQHDYHD